MSPSNMKELCNYSLSEYNRVTVRQKTTFSKARKFTHNRMWRDNTKKFTVEQLKLIKTL
jgi:hypothetical protein